MYDLIRRLTLKQLAAEQLPPFLLALLVAELFYKFHSFLLETGGFLLTWYVLDAIFSAVRRALAKPAAPGAQ